MGRKSRIKKLKKSEDIPAAGTASGMSHSSRYFAENAFFHILLIVFIAFLSYSNTFHVPFQWDDKFYIKDNPVVKDLSYFSEPSKAKPLDQFRSKLYSHLKSRYIGYLTFALNYKLHGFEVFGYHVFNFSVHVLNAMLVYGLVLLIFRTPFLAGSSLKTQSGYIALFSSLLFVSHPVQTEAVTYIYQRLASLAVFFYLCAVTAYLMARLSEGKTQQYVFFAIALIATVIGMKTKENTFTIPVTIALIEFFFFIGTVRTRLLRLLPFFLTLFIIPLTRLELSSNLTNITDDIGTAAANSIDVARSEYFLTQFRVLVTYLRLLFLPVNQNLDYHYPLLKSFFDPQVYLSFIFLLCIFIFAVYLFFRSRSNPGLRVPAFGTFWFFIALSVESSLIPIQMIIDEYRIYLPSAGFFMALVTGIFLFMPKFEDRKIRTVIFMSLILLPLVFSYATYRRNVVWQTEISLWEDIARKAPQSIRAHNNLGNEYSSMGLIDKAIEHYEIALKLEPDNPDIHNNIGNAYISKKQVDTAIEHYSAALKLRPDFATANSNIGNAYVLKGMLDKAKEHYLTAIKLMPEHAGAHFNLGLIYRAQGLKNRAQEEFDIAKKLKPELRIPQIGK